MQANRGLVHELARRLDEAAQLVESWQYDDVNAAEQTILAWCSLTLRAVATSLRNLER